MLSLKLTKIVYSKCLALLIVLCLHNGCISQLNLEATKKEIAAFKPDLKLDTFTQVFIIHFSFCSSTKYCGQNLIDFIRKKVDRPTLVIYDVEEQNYLDQLRQIDAIELLQIPIEYMQERGFFSVYNLWYRGKRKEKKLI